MEFVINTFNDNMILLGSLVVVVVTGLVLFWWKRSSTSPKYEAVDDDYWDEDSGRKGKKLPVKTRSKKAKPDKGKTAAAPNGHVPSVKQNVKASPSITKINDVERREKNEVAKQKLTPSAAGGKKLQQKSQLQSAESPSGEWKTIPVSKRKQKAKKDEETKETSELPSTPVEQPVDAFPAAAETQQVVNNSVSLETESSEPKCEERQETETVCRSRDVKQESVAVGDAVTNQETSVVQHVLSPPAAVETTDDDRHLELTAEDASSDVTAAAAAAAAAAVATAAAVASVESVEAAEVNVETTSKSAAKKKKKKNKAAKDQLQTSTVMSQSSEGDNALTTSTELIEAQPTPTAPNVEAETKLESVAEAALSRVVAPTVVDNDVTSSVVSMDTVAPTPVTETIPAAKPAVVFDELGDEPQSAVNKKKKKPRRDN